MGGDTTPPGDGARPLSSKKKVSQQLLLPHELTLAQEGFAHFAAKFGPEAYVCHNRSFMFCKLCIVTLLYSYTLHHRFFFHTDSKKRLWLAAEDGCEGVGPVLQDRAAGHS
jgi:hypothetical protein